MAFHKNLITLLMFFIGEVSNPLSARTKEYLLQLETNHWMDTKRVINITSNLYNQHQCTFPSCFHTRGRSGRHWTHWCNHLHLHNLDTELPNRANNKPFHLDKSFTHMG